MSISSVSSSNSYLPWLQSSKSASSSAAQALPGGTQQSAGTGSSSLVDQLKTAIDEILSGKKKDEEDDKDPLKALRDAIDEVLRKNGIAVEKSSDTTETAGLDDSSVQTDADKQRLMLSLVKSLVGQPDLSALNSSTATESDLAGLVLNVSA